MPKTYLTADLDVALKYNGKNASKVAAKGKDTTAEQILAIAE